MENWNGNVLRTVEGLSFRGDTGCQMLMKAAGLVGITGVFDCACWRRTRGILASWFFILGVTY